MSLRLAGEESSEVQGLDGQGWLRQITRNDTLPGLSLRQQGPGEALRSRVSTGGQFIAMVRDSDGAVLGWLKENSGLELVTGAGVDVRLAPGAGGVIKALAEIRTEANRITLQGGYMDRCAVLYGESVTGLKLSPQAEPTDAPVTIRSRNGDNSSWLDRLKVHSYANVARIEVLNAAFNIPAATHSSPAEGDLRWNDASHKLQVYTGTAWETVTSA
ncbi:MAG: hypothetical protein HYY01_01250 [Chloroflexi bacterium]|nr:hypothetical protein [Chloroflexota bacterium]